jgi:hypothetical protein
MFNNLPCEYNGEQVHKILHRGISFDAFDFDAVSVEMIELMAALGFEIEVDGDRGWICFSFAGIL